MLALKKGFVNLSLKRYASFIIKIFIIICLDGLAVSKYDCRLSTLWLDDQVESKVFLGFLQEIPNNSLEL